MTNKFISTSPTLFVAPVCENHKSSFRLVGITCNMQSFAMFYLVCFLIVDIVKNIQQLHQL